MFDRVFISMKLASRLWTIVLLLPLAPLLASTHVWGEVDSTEWAATAPDILPDASVVVLFDIGNLEIDHPSDKQPMHLKRHVRMKILSKEGASAAVSIEIPLYDAEELKEIKAQTLMSDGTAVPVAADEVFQAAHAGARFSKFTFPAVEDGCIVEFYYEVASLRYGLIPPWHFQNRYYTHESAYMAQLHRGLNYTAVTSNLPDSCRAPLREEFTVDSTLIERFTWRMWNIAPLEIEPYMCAIESFRPSVQLQLISFSNGLFDQYFYYGSVRLGGYLQDYHYTLSRDRKDRLKSAMKEFAPRTRDPQKVLRGLFDFVQNEIMTIENPRENHVIFASPESTLSIRQGTAAAKNYLLICLLQIAGLEAHPLLIGTTDYSLFNPEVCAMRQFNYLLCYVKLKNDVYALDCSDRWVPFPLLPPYAQATGGLLVDGARSRMVPLENVPRRSGWTATSRISVAGSGAATCTTHVTAFGYLMSSLRKALDARRDSDELKRILLPTCDLEFDLVDYRVDEYLDHDSSAVELVLHFPEIGRRVGNHLAIATSLFALKDSPFQKTSRLFPVEFGFTFHYAESVVITVDSTFQIVAAPENRSVQASGVAFSQTVLFDQRNARILSNVNLKKSRFYQQEYSELRRVYEEMALAAGDPLVVERK